MLSQDSLAVHAGRNGLTELGVHAVPIDLSTTAPLPSVHDGGLAYEHMATRRHAPGRPEHRLPAALESHRGKVRGGRRRPRRHSGVRRVRHRHGGAERGAARRRRDRKEARGGGAAAVRRKRLPACLRCARQRRHVHHPGGRPRRAPARHRPGDPRDAGQPEPGAGRYRPRGRRRGRSPAAGRQHLREPDPPAAVQARRRHGAAQRHQVPRRPRRRHGRRGGRRSRVDHAAAPDPRRHRRHPHALAGLPAPPRAGHAAGARARPAGQRPEGRQRPGRPRACPRESSIRGCPSAIRRG